MKPSERLALACVRDATGRDARRNPVENDVPDLEILDHDPTVAIEVKEVTVEQARALAGQMRTTPFFKSERLTKWWTVTVDTPTLDELYPMADYSSKPPPSDAFRKAYEDACFTVVEDTAPESPASLPHPRLKGVFERLEPLLVRAEAAGLETTFTIPDDNDAHMITIEYRWLMGGTSVASAHDPRPQHDRPAGIELTRGTSIVSTGNPDRFLARAEEFMFTSDKGEDLCMQFTSCSHYGERHAFLVMDSLEPESARVHEWDTTVVPSRPPVLPDVVDALWVSLGHLCWHWHPDRGWSVSEIPIHDLGGVSDG